MQIPKIYYFYDLLFSWTWWYHHTEVTSNNSFQLYLHYSTYLFTLTLERQIMYIIFFKRVLESQLQNMKYHDKDENIFCVGLSLVNQCSACFLVSCTKLFSRVAGRSWVTVVIMVSGGGAVLRATLIRIIDKLQSPVMSRQSGKISWLTKYMSFGQIIWIKWGGFHCKLNDECDHSLFSMKCMNDTKYNLV